jgi:hypothetical protein
MRNSNIHYDSGIVAKQKDIDWDAIPNAIKTILNDGHVPETFRATNNRNVQTQQQQQQQYLRIYPEYHLNRQAHVQIIDHAVPEKLVRGLYDYTIHYCLEHPIPAWGSYVTIQQIQDLWQLQKQQQQQHEYNIDTTSQEDLSLHAAAHFFRNAMRTSDADQNVQHLTSIVQQQKLNEGTQPNSQPCHLWSRKDMLDPSVHGVAVWALASNVGASVPYHIDYAELIRYEHGYLVPPVMAGTLHCTPHNIVGGEYCVTTNGLDHYAKYGYKGMLHVNKNLAPENEMKSKDGTNKKNFVTNANEIMKNDADSWICIPFQYNRMICQSGHLPHLSTPVDAIIASSRHCGDDTNETNVSASTTTTPIRRVIVGFNVFLQDIGLAVQQAPEHSDAFRQRVAALRKRQVAVNNRSAAASSSDNEHINHGKISINTIKSNPRLAACIVRAKREIVKKNLKIAQTKLDQDIQEYIQKVLGTKYIDSVIDRKMQKLTIEAYDTFEKDIILQFGRHDGEWPNPVDVQVHFQHRFHSLRPT